MKKLIILALILTSCSTYRTREAQSVNNTDSVRASNTTQAEVVASVANVTKEDIVRDSVVVIIDNGNKTTERWRDRIIKDVQRDTITITKHIETHDTIFIKKETENIQKEAKRQTVSPYKYIIALTALVVILLAVAVRRYFK